MMQQRIEKEATQVLGNCNVCYEHLIIFIEDDMNIKYLAIIESAFVGYKEFCRSRRSPRSAEFFMCYESRIY